MTDDWRSKDEISLDNLDHRQAVTSVEDDQQQGGWRFQNPARVRQKIKRIVQRELRNPDLMSEEDALVVGASFQNFALFNTFRVLMLHDYVITTLVFSAPRPLLPNSTGEAGIISKLVYKERASKSKKSLISKENVIISKNLPLNALNLTLG